MDTIKRFENKGLGLSIDTRIDSKQNIWFKGKDVALALGYENTRDALIRHVDDDYKTQLKRVVKHDSSNKADTHTLFGYQSRGSTPPNIWV